VGTAFLPRLRGRRGERRDKISPGAWPSPRRGPGGATPAPGVRVLPKVAGAVQEALEPAERLRGLPTADPQGVPGVAAQGVEVPFPQAQVSPQEAAPAELLTLAILLPPPLGTWPSADPSGPPKGPGAQSGRAVETGWKGLLGRVRTAIGKTAGSGARRAPAVCLGLGAPGRRPSPGGFRRGEGGQGPGPGSWRDW
jgi:hypothetical protein